MKEGVWEQRMTEIESDSSEHEIEPRYRERGLNERGSRDEHTKTTPRKLTIDAMNSSSCRFKCIKFSYENVSWVSLELRE